MVLNVLIAVAAIWGMAAVTPGPNFFITVHTAVDSNRRSSLLTVLGIVFGTMIWSVSGFWGISILFKTVPFLYYTVKLFGGFYLIFVGLCLIFKKNHQHMKRSIRCASAGNYFRLGLLTNLLNPKTAVFMTGLFAAAIPPSTTIKSGAACIVVICLISASWYSMVATMHLSQRQVAAFIFFSLEGQVLEKRGNDRLGRCAGFRSYSKPLWARGNRE